ncbi:conserved Plasmodium protein, unknown function [Plasmodium relictum]|uniref:Uncharacterized protein n=1 Tax=Plasmodium relictum TaxID=85471 RepID=A0A1J1H7Z4_PLARL|nr:conserved Plasmodium protein, unknown function [Plasmodium relictum]CRH00787.1 conserved Plasmodium protein, unknown function [Plasmodium relictum]
MVLKKRNINSKNTQLKACYNKDYVEVPTILNAYNEANKNMGKCVNNHRKKKLSELLKVLNIKNSNKPNYIEFNEKVTNSKKKLKKKIISDSSFSEDNTLKKENFVEKMNYENDFYNDKNILLSNDAQDDFIEVNKVNNATITDKKNNDLQTNEHLCSKKYLNKDFVNENSSTEIYNEKESNLLFNFISSNTKNDITDINLCKSSIDINDTGIDKCNENYSNRNSFDKNHLNKNSYKKDSNANIFSENESNKSDPYFSFNGKMKKKKKIISSNEDSNSVSDYPNLYESSHGTDLSYDDMGEKKKRIDEYALHLKIFNEQNLDNDYFNFNSLSIKKSIRLYIEFIALSLLSPNFKYNINYFKVSENTKKIADLLKLNYSNIHKEFEKKKFLDEYYDKSNSSIENLKKIKKKKKNLKKLFEYDSDSEKNKEETYNRNYSSNFIIKSNKMNKKKKKYILSDSSFLSDKEINKKNESYANISNTEKFVKESHNGKFEVNKSEINENEKGEQKEEKEQRRQEEEYYYDDENNDEYDDESDYEDEDNDEYEECESDIFGSSKEEKEYAFNYSESFKKKIMKDINDSFMYKILNDDMLKIYEFLKKEENFSNYDFLKMICKISKNKSENYYDRCIQKIENKILSKRDQFESHPFQISFKNILKNYANIFIFYLEYNKICCSCCSRKLNYACPVFFIKPFYNSTDLWNNCFFNFMRVNKFEWLGKLYFNNFSNPMDILKNEKNDELKMKKIKDSNKLFVKNQNEKGRKSFLQIINSNCDNTAVLRNEKYILNHLKEYEEFNAHRYINRIEERRLKRKRRNLNYNYNFYFKGECEENSINLVMKDICEHFCDLSENYIEKDILVLQLGSYCVSTVYYWHVFHHYKFFFTKIIYIRLLDLYKKNRDLFKEPLLLAYVLSKKLHKKLYQDFKILMNIDISQIKNKLNECDLFIK